MNRLYSSFKDRILQGQLNWLSDPFALALYDSGGVFNDTHGLIVHVGGNQISPGQLITGKSVGDGYVYMDNTIYRALTSSLTVVSAILYRTTDGALVAYFDEVEGFPLIPTGSDYGFAPSGPDGALFRL